MAVVIFHRFGPYHLARLNAAGGWVTGLELYSRDNTYAWDAASGGDSFRRITLVESEDNEDHTPRILASRIWQALNAIAPPAVVLPGWSGAGAAAALRWCSAHAVPAVLMSESQEIDEPRTWWKERVKRRFVGLCSAALVGGRLHADYLVQLRMLPERIFLGYDAVDNRYFADKAEGIRKQKAESTGENAEILKAEMLKSAGQRTEEGGRKTDVGGKHGLPERYFLASARFIEKKNLPRLLQAYARYREKAEMLKTEKLNADGPWDLVLLGDGPLRATLEAQLSALNLHGCVHMPGFKQYPDLPAYYGLASAFIHASTTEQWGLVVNEAMASGLPVLVSNRCGCASDLVQEGVNGFTFDPYNVEELAGLMWKLSTLNSQLSKMGDASRAIITDWGPERFASGLQQAVETALRVPRPKAGLADRLLLRLLALR